MSRSLEEAAGDNLRVILGKTTSNNYLAVFIGMFVTALIQSSGATSVMCAGFVNSGLMTLSSFLYVILGADIGTTITAQIIAFKITTIAPLILFIGMVMYLFVKKKIVKKIGGVVLGFGLLFVGIYLMGDSVRSIPQLTTLVESFVEKFSNPVVCLLFGVTFTALIQSSSTSIGILQVIVSTSIGASAGLEAFIYIIMGMNIGACSPVVIVSFSGNQKCKQAALSCVFAKFFSTLIFIVLLLLLPQLVTGIEHLSPNDLSRQIANFHLVFNVISSILIFPFAPWITKLAARLLPESEEEEMAEMKLNYINPAMDINPSVAVKQAKLEILRMAKIVESNLKTAIESFFEGNYEKAENVLETEKLVNYLNHNITGYLVQLHAQKMSDKDIEQAGMMLRVVSDIERIGDHAENVAEATINIRRNNSFMSAEAIEELKVMSKKTLDVLDLSIAIYDKKLFDRLDEVTDMEEAVDQMEEEFVEKHIERLKMSACDPRSGVIFTDLVSCLERCSDHAINIAFAINGEKSMVQIKKAYIVTRDMS